MKQVKIGMAQLLVEGGEPGRNLDRARLMIEQASTEKCNVILLPECLDLAWTHPSSKKEAEPIPGKHSKKLCEWAKENSIYVCAGLTEKAGNKIYNAAVLINNQGEIILTYRKINVLAQEYYAIGNKLGVVDTPFGVVGVNICSDNYMDGINIGHTLARMGAQLILSPSSWTVGYSTSEGEDPYGEKWIKPYTLLTKTYGLTLVGTTSVGTIVGGPYEGRKMVGCSLAMNEKGILAQGSFNEFSGELVTVSTTLKPRTFLGTQLSGYATFLGNSENGTQQLED